VLVVKTIVVSLICGSWVQIPPLSPDVEDGTEEMTPEAQKEPELRKFGDKTGTYADTTGTYGPVSQTGTVIVWDSIDSAVTYNVPPKKAEQELPPPRSLSGKCKFCGQFQNGLVHHENNVCDKRFRRKR